MHKVCYNDADHSYTVDGVPAVSVTTIAKAVSGLDYGFVKDDVMQDALERGNAIHAEIETWQINSPEAQFIASKLSDVFESEKIVGGFICGFAVAGRVDLISRNILGDIKTTSAANKVYCTIQLNLYRQLVIQNDFWVTQKLEVYHTPKSGKYKVIDIPVLPESKIAEIIMNYKLGVIMSEKELLETTELSVVAQKLNVSELTPAQLFVKIGELTEYAKQAKEVVEKKLQDYSAENYSEDNIQAAKDDKAALNNFAKTLNGNRLELEKKWLVPFNEFKGIINETCDAVKSASSKIDEIVKVVAERETEKRLAEINAIFEKQNCTLFTPEQIFLQKWLNKGTKLKDIEADIKQKIAEVENNLKIIDRLNEPDVKAFYLETLDIAAAMREADRLKTNRERLAALENQKNEPAPEPPEEEAGTTPQAVAEAAPAEEEPVQEEILERVMRVWGTKEQIIALANFMNQNGIRFNKE